mgnify:CR=1 FL=1
MLMIRLANPDDIPKLCTEAGLTHQTGIMACQAVEDGCEAGFVLFRFSGKTLELLKAHCPPPLLDGLLRAALNRGAAAGLVRFSLTPAMQGWQKQLIRLGYPAIEEKTEIEQFFSRGCGQILKDL